MYMYSIVSSTVQNGLSPLYAASAMGHSQIVDILLLKGAEPNLTTKVRMCTGVAITSLTCVLCASALSYL